MSPYGVARVESADDVRENVFHLHNMASGAEAERKFHRDRVKNATHHVALRTDEGWIFAPVKWSGAKENSIDLYWTNKQPVTDHFKTAIIDAGFHPLSKNSPAFEELYAHYVAYCNHFGFHHSITAEARTFYINDYLGSVDDELSDNIKFVEGATSTIRVNAYERNPEARRKCIELHGAQCKVCDFDFLEAYGELGRGYIHVHHVIPLSSIGEEYEVDPAVDLVPVCPNCHAMLHHRGIRSVEELRSRLR